MPPIECRVAQWVKDLDEKVFGKSKLAAGKVVTHPDGRQVKITGGQYWGEYGVSNFWEWHEVRADGTLAKKQECGYGWM